MLEVQRAAVYGLLARLFTYPREDTLEILSRGNLLESLSGLDEGLVTPVYQLTELIQTLGYARLCEEYVHVFGHTVSNECPPYETSYGESNIFQQTQVMADIAGFYKAWGLDLAPDAHDRVDHISAECEFMGFLLLKLHYVRSKGEKEAEEICLDSCKKFLKDHMGKWVPNFSILVIKKAPNGLYAEAAKFMKNFVEKESEIFGVEPVKYNEKDLPFAAFEESECLQCPP